MRVQKNQFSMQVMLGKAKMSKDRRVSIAIRLTVPGRIKTFYLRVKIHPDRFSEQSELVKLTKGNLAEAQAINKVIKEAKSSLYKQWKTIAYTLGHVAPQTTAEYLDRFTLNDDSHESK